jgi:hypothetical protein
VVPGAQQLELLRRLNLTGPVSPELAARVLDASAVGRGQPDLELVGAAAESPFGPRPVDPARVSANELLRVAVAVLTEDVVAAGLPPRRRPGWVRPWRTRYRLAGDPELVDPLRAHLVARGRPPGGGGAPVVLLGTDLGRMLADVWTARCFDRGARAWRPWLRRIVERDRLPGGADLLRAARRWEARVGRDRVHVVLDPAALPGLLGVRRLPALAAPPAAEVPDLGRRIATVLGLHVPGDQRTALLHHAVRPRLAQAPGLPLGIPPEHRDWVRGHADRVAGELRRAGYAVHGEPQAWQPAGPATVGAPSDAATLDLALRMMLTGAARTSTSEEGRA